jgi:hypothetical protein
MVEVQGRAYSITDGLFALGAARVVEAKDVGSARGLSTGAAVIAQRYMHTMRASSIMQIKQSVRIPGQAWTQLLDPGEGQSPHPAESPEPV